MGSQSNWPGGLQGVLVQKWPTVASLIAQSRSALSRFQPWNNFPGRNPKQMEATVNVVAYIVSVPLAEKTLIARIRKMSLQAKNPAIRTGIGDDCAVLSLTPRRESKTESDTLLTTDFSLEGIHFRREWHQPESVGHRCLARGLSDIAAMGGTPVAAFLSMALPRNLPHTWVDRFARSLIRLAREYGVTLAGGDTAQSPNGILADIVVLGTVPKGKAVLRSGARPGDHVYVSGELGGSAASVVAMRRQPRRKLNPRCYPRHFFPQPRVELGRILRENGLATAMIDTSDGLSTDLAHICEESSVGAELLAEAVPKATVGKPPHEVDLQLALHGGEDYELLFTAPPGQSVSSRLAGVRVTRIGCITRTPKIFLIGSDGIRHRLNPHGWEHFAHNG